jgi:hypothetical protein
MAILGYLKAQITARAGVLRAATGRAYSVGGDQDMFLVDVAPNAYAGEFLYTEEPINKVPECDPNTPTTFTRVAR